MVYAEKLREDAIRAEDGEVVRWTWADLRNFDATAARIRERFRSADAARTHKLGAVPRSRPVYGPDILVRAPGRYAARASSLAVTCASEGFVSAVPSGKRITRHGLVAAVHAFDERRGVGVALDVDLVVGRHRPASSWILSRRQ